MNERWWWMSEFFPGIVPSPVPNPRTNSCSGVTTRIMIVAGKPGPASIRRLLAHHAKPPG